MAVRSGVRQPAGVCRVPKDEDPLAQRLRVEICRGVASLAIFVVEEDSQDGTLALHAILSSRINWPPYQLAWILKGGFMD